MSRFWASPARAYPKISTLVGSCDWTASYAVILPEAIFHLTSQSLFVPKASIRCVNGILLFDWFVRGFRLGLHFALRISQSGARVLAPVVLDLLDFVPDVALLPLE